MNVIELQHEMSLHNLVDLYNHPKFIDLGIFIFWGRKELPTLVQSHIKEDKITIFKILAHSNLLNNTLLLDLLTHMIAFNPYDRYNIVQCINHKYFTS